MELPDIPYKISYRRIKYPRLEFKTGELILILPPGYDGNNLLRKKGKWILAKSNLIKECLKNSNGKKISSVDEKEFKKIVLIFTTEYSEKLKVKINKVYFRNMKTKWGSLSIRRNLTINLLMKYLPEYLVRYVIFHEITHIIERTHNDRYWRIITKNYENFQDLEMELFAYWFLLIKKLK